MVPRVCFLTALLAVSVRAGGYAAGGYADAGLSAGLAEGLGDGGLGGDLSGGADLAGGLADAGGYAGQAFSAGSKFSCIGGSCGNGAGLGSLPIMRTQKVDFVNVPQAVAAPVEPANLLVDSHMNPISLVYRSFGAPINILQKHIPARGTFKQTQSEEEPHRHVHTIHKPVIQEVREIISPIRLVRQEIQPVRENIQTIVAKATPVAPAPLASPTLAQSFPAKALAVGGAGLGGGISCSGAGCGGLVGKAHGRRLVAGPAIGFAGGDYGHLTAAGKAY